MPGGRPPIPSKLTPELTARICDLIALGVPTEHCCKAVGISSETFRRWRKAGNRYDDPVYVDFVAAIKNADAQFVESNMRLITASAPRSWQAAAWMLERRKPEYFAQKMVEELWELKNQLSDLKTTLAAVKEAASEQRGA